MVSAIMTVGLVVSAIAFLKLDSRDLGLCPLHLITLHPNELHLLPRGSKDETSSVNLSFCILFLSTIAVSFERL